MNSKQRRIALHAAEPFPLMPHQRAALKHLMRTSKATMCYPIGWPGPTFSFAHAGRPKE